MNTSACGLICDDCQFFGKQCGGCFAVKGKPFWASEIPGAGICQLFDCSINSKRLNDCGGCVELPCKMFTELKDPSISDEEHKRMIQVRVKNLRS